MCTYFVIFNPNHSVFSQIKLQNHYRNPADSIKMKLRKIKYAYLL